LSKDLYFIPIIVSAMERPDPEKTLKQAFERIRHMGRQPEYKRGYIQFQRFMDAAKTQSKGRPESLGAEIARELILELAAGVFEGDQDERQSALEFLRSHPQWFNEYERLCAEQEVASEGAKYTVILVVREDNLVGKISFEGISGAGSIGNVEPGNYVLKLATGRYLWEGCLTERDVFWTEAFPDRDLDLAADTEEAESKPTREISLLDGELILRVYPGIESGHIQIEAKA
jgi:hypothetical protein